MESSYGSLVKDMIMLLDKFNTGRQCFDDFMEDASKDLQNMDALFKKFVLNAVSGCIEHKTLLDGVISLFYGQNEKSLFRRDRSQFVVICYLTIFALDDIGLWHFGNIIQSLDIKKIDKFLTFFFEHLTTWIQEEWSNIYDAAYVEKQWIEPLMKWRPEIEILMEQLAAKWSHGIQIKKAPTKTTKPKEFLLTKPKPPTLSMPELIPQLQKFKPVPKSTYSAPKVRQNIEEMRLKNQLKTQDLHYEADVNQFRCANPKMSEHTKKVMSQIDVDFNSKLKFNSFHSSTPPHSKKNKTLPIKLNHAAILRQGAQYNRNVEIDRQRLERLVAGTYEPSAFLQWQKEMLEKDSQEELAKIERRRLEGRIGHEEAALACKHMFERNQKTAQLKREETAELMRRYAEKRLQEEKEIRELVQQVAECHKNSKTAKEKLKKFKHSIVQEFSQQNRQLLRQALEEAQAELCRKFQAIQEIHAIESVPHISVRYFDDTETAGYDLLGEMSYAELKERLRRLKEAQQQDMQEKRDQILEEKQNKKQLELDQLDTDIIRRKVLSQAAAMRKEEEKNSKLRLQQTVMQDETVLALQRKLEEKKQERQRLENARTSEKAAAHTVRNRKSLKHRSWEELEQSLARHVQKAAPYVVSPID